MNTIPGYNVAPVDNTNAMQDFLTANTKFLLLVLAGIITIIIVRAS